VAAAAEEARRRAEEAEAAVRTKEEARRRAEEDEAAGRRRGGAAAAQAHNSFTCPLSILVNHEDALRLVTDAVHEDDALCLALTCRALRDVLWARFPRRQAGETHAGARVRTRDVAVVATVGRLAWARGLDQQWQSARQPIADGGNLRDNICETAARHGALASLQWARANGYDWAVGTCGAAAEGGHLVVLQWLRANGCEWDVHTCCMAARGGHLAVLQWARANGCDWDVDTCRAAAWGGHLAVLQWARANSCAWDTRTYNHGDAVGKAVLAGVNYGL
jgi:hypothetical protein